MSNSSRPMPAPSAVMSVPTVSEESIRSNRARSTFRILPRSGSTAWFFRARPCLAEPPAESPSTMKSSDSAGSFSLTVGQLAGQRSHIHRGLAPGHLARLARRLACQRRLDDLADDGLGDGGVLLEPLGELLVHEVLDRGPHLGGDQLVLRLAGEFRIRHLDRQNAGQPFARVVAGEIHLLAPGDAAVLRIFGDGPRQRPRKPARWVPPSRWGMLLVKGSTVS